MKSVFFARKIFPWLALLGILLLTVGLYLPFSENALVFDDSWFFTDRSVFRLAETPFSRYARTFPYFSIGLVHVLADGDLAWNRYLSLALHGLVVISLYAFLARALSRCAVEKPVRYAVVLAVCLWVALNPVAVYAAGYLIQRTIVFATLFAILSANLYLRAQAQERNADLFSAALMGGLSMLCKEHAVLLPLAVLVLTPLVRPLDRRVAYRALVYLGLTLPCMAWVAFHRAFALDIAGTNYEIYAGHVLAQFALPGFFDSQGGTWVMSILTQLIFFWKYLFLWLVPNPQWLSVDMRVDFPVLWAGGLGFMTGLFSVAALVFVAYRVWRARAKETLCLQDVVAIALLFALVLFVVELSVVRVQEPFVLYRSYLWMPAYALLLAALLLKGALWVHARQSPMAKRAFWLVIVLFCGALFPLAQNRLQSFSSEAAIWQDALLKLPRPDIPGADRVYYNLAREAFIQKDYTEALQWSEKVIKQNPTAFYGYLARGTTQLARNELDAALRDFDAADKLHPPKNFTGYIEYKRCLIIQRRNLSEEFISCLQRSAKMGYGGAKFQLQMMGLAEDASLKVN